VKRATLAVLASLVAGCAAQPQTFEHRVRTGAPGWKAQPVAPAALDARIREAANEYQEHAPVLRYAQYDAALPADQNEYDQMAGHGVIVLSVFSQDPAELPPKYFVAVVGSEQFVLPLVFGARTPVTDPQVAHVFGVNRWDGIYEIPVQLFQRHAEIHIDFAKNREGFVLDRFSDSEESLLKNTGLRVSAPSRSSAPVEARMKLIEREYPGFLSSDGTQG